ncbi:hypothetical protein J2W97_001198 [Paenibacillus jamilae]|nr:hypothetical protein [Paenibacillus jamilae]
MENIKNLHVQPAVVFENEGEKLVLIKGKSNVVLVTDETDYDKEYSGLITDLNEDYVEIENGLMIKWEYVISIESK